MAAQNLRTPGPTPLPPAVREALARDMVNHRGPEFAAILNECVAGLKWAYQVAEHDVVILTASGTGGLESLAANTLSAGDKLPEATVFLGPNEPLSLRELVEDGPKLLVFYLFDWSST